MGDAMAAGGGGAEAGQRAPAASSPGLAGHLAAPDAEELPVTVEHPASVGILCGSGSNSGLQLPSVTSPALSPGPRTCGQ